MQLLAIDSATEFCSVALRVNAAGNAGAETEPRILSCGEELPRQHSQALLPYVNELLTAAGARLKELDGIVVSQGPGSFTGVRIGASIAQGLAFSQQLPMAQVSTLAAMAQACYRLHGATHVAAAIDARMGEVYFGTYELVDGLMVLRGEERVCAPTQVQWPAQWHAQPDVHSAANAKRVMTCGTGWETYPDELTAALSGGSLGEVELEATDVRLPHALDMLELGYANFAAGDVIDALELSPNYLRNEVTWQKLPGRE